MCGRLNIIDEPILNWLKVTLGVDFAIEMTLDLRPSQAIGIIIESAGALQQLNATWGIKPQWSKSLLINAQSETVAEKPTFKKAFANRRCLVPCTGWYEWKDEGRAGKSKYLFTRADGDPWLMGGIWYPSGTGPQLVTLTTHPNSKCSTYHNRMPVLIAPEQIDDWFGLAPEAQTPIMEPVPEEWVKIEGAKPTLSDDARPHNLRH